MKNVITVVALILIGIMLAKENNRRKECIAQNKTYSLDYGTCTGVKNETRKHSSIADNQ